MKKSTEIIFTIISIVATVVLYKILAPSDIPLEYGAHIFIIRTALVITAAFFLPRLLICILAGIGSSVAILIAECGFLTAFMIFFYAFFMSYAIVTVVCYFMMDANRWRTEDIFDKETGRCKIIVG